LGLLGYAITPNAHAQCLNANSLAQTTIGAGGPASAAASDTFFHSGTPLSFIAQGTGVYAVRTGTGGAMSPYWTRNFAVTVDNFPVPVPLHNGEEAVFVAASDGFVYRLDATTGNPRWSADLRRKTAMSTVLCADDKVIATPTTQLWAYSNAAFRMALGGVPTDLVFVVTRYGCGTTTANRVYALKGSDGSVVWTYNPSGFVYLDFGSESPSIDYENNRLYVGLNQPATRPSQHTVYALSTTNGTKLWSVNSGSVRGRPFLRAGRLYVISHTATLFARDPATGAEIWNLPLTGSHYVEKNLWAEPRVSGGHDKRLFVVDSGGYLHGVTDYSDRGTRDWGAAVNFGGSVKSLPAVFPNLGKGYVGMADGKLKQFDLVTGVSDAQATVGGATSTVYEPTLDVNSTSDTMVNRLMVASDNRLKRYCIPWAAGSLGTSALPPDVPAAPKADGGIPFVDMAIQPVDAGFSPPDMAMPIGDMGVPQGCTQDSQCPSSPTACTTGRCNTATGACYFENSPDGTPCSDGLACTCDSAFAPCPVSPGLWDSCRSGICTSNVSTTCACNAVGGRACGGGQECCGVLGCKDLLTDNNNCGSCGQACGAGKQCNGGTCVRSTAGCTSNLNRPTDATALNASAMVLEGAGAITYGEAPECYAHLSGVGPVVDARTYTVSNLAGATIRPIPITSLTKGITEARIGPKRVLFGTLANDPAPGGTWPPGLYFHDRNTSAAGVLPVIPAPAPTFCPSAGTTACPAGLLENNQGPVGPAFERSRCAAMFSPDVGYSLFVANWVLNGDVHVIHTGSACIGTPGSCLYSGNLVANLGSRVAAIAYGKRGNDNYVYVAHGTMISGFCTSSGDSATVCIPCPDTFDVDVSSVAPDGILSLTVDALYGDVYFEGRNGGSYRLGIIVSDPSLPAGGTVQLLSTTQTNFGVPAVPNFLNEGRLGGAESGVGLQRFEVGALLGAIPGTFTDVVLLP
jgi:outer membrane protein assembly factor BamB